MSTAVVSTAAMGTGARERFRLDMGPDRSDVNRSRAPRGGLL